MGRVSSLSPATELALARMDAAIDAAIAGEPIYPNDTLFVGSDLEGLGEVLRRGAREDFPVLIVYPDGEERLLLPA